MLFRSSNAGAQAIVEPKHLGFATGDTAKADYENMKSNVMDEVKRIFRPEFLNRISETIVFKPLTRDDLHNIVNLLSTSLKKRCKESFDITLDIKKDVLDYIVDKAYEPKYGARPLRRKIQTEIEDPLSEEILYGRIKRGDKASVVSENGKLVFKTQNHNKSNKK